MKRRFAAWRCLIALLMPMPAYASGLGAPNVGTSRSGPSVLDAAAVFWNPGLLGFLDKGELMLNGSLLVGIITYERERRGLYQREDSFDFALPVDADAIDPSKTGTSNSTTANPIAPLPNLFFSYPIADTGLTAGFGVYSPYAALLAFDGGGPQQWQLDEALIATVNFTPTITWRPHRMVSVGVGVSYVVGLLQLDRVQDLATLPDLGAALESPSINQANDFGADAPTGVRELAVMARPISISNAWAHSITFNAGVAVQPMDNLMLGLTYQHSTAMNFRGDFQLNMDDDFFTQDLASQGLQYPAIVRGDASVSFTLPNSILFGASYDFTEQWGADVMFGYVFWSTVERFDVRAESPDLAQPELGLPSTTSISLERQWNDTITVEGTGRFRPLKPLMLWLTGGYQSSASPDSTIDVASPDGDRIVVNTGLSFDLFDNFSLLGDIEVQSILPRTVVGSNFDVGNGEYRLTLISMGVHGRIFF